MALVTRYSPDDSQMKISMNTASKYVPTSVRQWGQVKICNGGDQFKCHALLKGQRQAYDCMYMKVSLFHSPFFIMSPQLTARHKYEAKVDFYKCQANMALVMMKKMFFAELHRIVHLKLSASEELFLDECKCHHFDILVMYQNGLNFFELF